MGEGVWGLSPPQKMFFDFRDLVHYGCYFYSLAARSTEMSDVTSDTVIKMMSHPWTIDKDGLW